MSFLSPSDSGGGSPGLPQTELLSSIRGGMMPFGKKPKPKNQFATFLGGDMSANPSATTFGSGGGSNTLLGQ